MRCRLSNNLLTDVQSLAWAVVVHAAAAQVFIFSIPFQHIPERPGMTFWGSFLASVDRPFSGTAAISNGRADVDVLSHPRGDGHARQFMKPAADYTALTAEKNKTSSKTTFLREAPPASVYTYPQSRHYQETKAEYQPLRFQPRSLP